MCNFVGLRDQMGRLKNIKFAHLKSNAYMVYCRVYTGYIVSGTKHVL